MAIEWRGESVRNAQSRPAALQTQPPLPARPLPAPRHAPGAGAGSPGTHPRRWLMLPVVLMAMFMAGFDI
jgi:hypothetical protein